MKNLTLSSALLIINVLFLGIVASAQGNIEGYIKDVNTDEVQAFTLVQLVGQTNYGMYTDGDGFYSFENIKEGNYDLKISYSDTFVTYPNVMVLNNTTEYLTVTASFDRMLTGGEVIGIKDLFVLDKPNVPKIDADKIANEKPRSPVDIIKRVPSAVETSEGISFKGSRPGTGVYYIDGVRTYNELSVPMSAVSSIEVYNGGIPARYGNTTSAVIVVETKSYIDKF